jgi:predicted PurR-regulated permease PerM
VRRLEDSIFPRLFKKMKGKASRGFAIAFTYLLVFTVVGLFLALVVPQIIASLVGIGANVPSYLKSLQSLYYRASNSMSEAQVLQDSQVSAILETAMGYLLTAFETLLERLGEWLTGDLLEMVVGFVARLTSGILDGVLGVIISIYFLADREKLMAQTRKVFEAVLKGRTTQLLREILADTHRVFSGFIIGKIIDSIIIGLLCFIFMSILRLPYPMLISVIVGVTNVIPYFGPFIGAIPGFLLTFISSPDKGPGQSLIFLIFILLLQQFDGNILGPKILGDTTGLSGFWVLVSIMLFSGLLGVWGMFLGVPLFAVIYNLFKRVIHHILRKQGRSENTRDYATEQNPLIK